MKKNTKSEKPAAPQAKPVAKKSAEPAPAAAKKAVVPKKVPTPKTPAAPAAATTSAPSAPPAPAKAATPVLAITTIIAQNDVGFGNHLYVRGDAPGLSWEQGVPMSCVADDRWSLTLADASKPVLFKFLLNDTTWSTGEDYVVNPGDTVVLTPAF